jgi:hypothetical protein
VTSPQPVATLPDTSHARIPDVTQTVYLLFQQTTGAVLGRYVRQTVGAEESAPQDGPAILAMAEQSGALQAITADQSSIDAVVLDDPALAYAADLWVDPATRRPEPLPQLKLTADRQALTGDGTDTVRIGIAIVGANGGTLPDRSDRIRVTTTHGKLSSPGGLVEVRDGVGEITLRSTSETVPLVAVKATSETGLCARGVLRLEFS